MPPAAPQTSSSTQTSQTGQAGSPAQPSTGASTSSGQTVSFTDIGGVGAEQAIKDMGALGIFGGVTGAFRPNDAITRAEFVRWLVIANNIYYKDVPAQQIRLVASGPATFVDVPATHPDFAYIQGMASAHYAIGVDATHFAPDRPITREEMIAIKAGRDESGAAMPPVDIMFLHYSDNAEITKIYTGAIHEDTSVRTSNNVSRVWGSIKTLYPQKPVTRAEAVLCLSEFGGEIPDASAAKAVGSLQASTPPSQTGQAGSTGAPAATGQTVSFTDISAIAAEQAIRDMGALGVFGSATGAFKPNEPITRAEFVRWLVTANNVYYRDTPAQQIRLAESGAATFVDVPPTHPNFKYIQGMANAGYVIGVDATHFAPDQALTREQMISVKVARDEGGTAVKPLSDYEIAHAIGLQYSDRAKINKIYTGYVHEDDSARASHNTARVWGAITVFSPQMPVTRSEAVLCLSVFGGEIPDASAAKAVGRVK
jgi:hypothetical protein